jgi:hypothetical protein
VLQTKLRPSLNVKEFEAQLEESLLALKVDYLDLFADPRRQRQGFGGLVAGIRRLSGCRRALAQAGAHSPHRILHARGEAAHLAHDRKRPLRLRELCTTTTLFQDNLPMISSGARATTWACSSSARRTRAAGCIEGLGQAAHACANRCRPWCSTICGAFPIDDIHTLSLGCGPAVGFRRAHEGAAAVGESGAGAGAHRRALAGGVSPGYRRRFCRSLGRGLPEWNVLPGKINVRRILWLRNLVLAYDLLDFAQERYMSMSPTISGYQARAPPNSTTPR